MSTHSRPGWRPGRTTRPRPTALVPLTVVLALVTLAAGASAQHDGATPLLRLGETVHGALSASDDVLEDGSFFQSYRLESVAGEAVVITLESDDFDAYLLVGRWADGELEVLAVNDDGDDGTNSRVWWLPPATGSYVVQASSLFPGETGRYALSVRAAPAIPAVGTAWAVPIVVGEARSGILAHGDPMLDDGSYYHLYSFEAAAGERFVITLRSSDFDAFLTVGWADEDELMPLATDDDGGGETDARLLWAAPGAGTYLIQANSFGGGETGRYTLTVERGARR
jgi:hypothetical protein